MAAAVDVGKSGAGLGGNVDDPGGGGVVGVRWVGLLGLDKSGECEKEWKDGSRWRAIAHLSRCAAKMGHSVDGGNESNAGEAGLSTASALATTVEMILLWEHEIRTWLRWVSWRGPWGRS